MSERNILTTPWRGISFIFILWYFALDRQASGIFRAICAGSALLTNGRNQAIKWISGFTAL
jgi:hypothetical protein